MEIFFRTEKHQGPSISGRWIYVEHQFTLQTPERVLELILHSLKVRCSLKPVYTDLRLNLFYIHIKIHLNFCVKQPLYKKTKATIKKG